MLFRKVIPSKNGQYFAIYFRRTNEFKFEQYVKGQWKPAPNNIQRDQDLYIQDYYPYEGEIIERWPQSLGQKHGERRLSKLNECFNEIKDFVEKALSGKEKLYKPEALYFTEELRSLIKLFDKVK